MAAAQTRVRLPAAPGRADVMLGRAGVAFACWLLLVAGAAVPLIALGWWYPALAAAVVLVGAVVALWVARSVPIVPPTGSDVPGAAVTILVAVAVGAGVWAGATHAEHVVLRRDAGTYALFGQHLATTHGDAVAVRVADVGGPAVLDLPGVTVGSPGFYQQGSGEHTHVVPQFLSATPVWLSLGWWLGGWTVLLLVPAVALAAALLAFAGLAVRIVGPWWAVLATGTLAVTQPVLHAGRSTYSEPFALLVVCAGATVLLAALTSRDLRSAKRQALLAGLILGGAALVRVDALRESALLLPVAALLAIRPPVSGQRRGGVAGSLVVGLAVSSLVAAGGAALLARPYLASIAGSLVPLAAGVAGLAVLSIGVVWAGRRGGRLPGRLRRALPALPAVLAALVLIVGLGLATRPWWQVVRQSAADPGARVVAGLQSRQGLVVDGGRTYAEHSVQWVSWWVGVPVLVLALLAAAVSAYRVTRRWLDGEPLPPWWAPAVVAFGSIVLTLYRPGITPDHPWADRRLVPVVLPAVVLFAVGAARAGLRSRRWRQMTSSWPGVLTGPLTGTATAIVVLAVVAPAVIATIPVAAQRTERGEVAAVQQACAAFGPDDSAILVDARAANEWTQVLRGVCGVPTVAVRASGAGAKDAETVRTVARAIAGTGRRPILVSAGSAGPLSALAVPPRHVLHLVTTEDQRLLTRRPDGQARLTVDLWVGAAG